MSITFTKFRNQEWENKINQELYAYLEVMTKHHLSSNQGIYCFHETHHIGGILFQLQSNILWIDGMFISEKFRRQGIGRKLIEEASKHAIQHNIKEMQTNTFFPDARDFFKACEFEEITNLPNWKYGSTCYFLKKSL
jgi:GNAT superfamily N-acetyltransferase